MRRIPRTIDLFDSLNRYKLVVDFIPYKRENGVRHWVYGRLDTTNMTITINGENMPQIQPLVLTHEVLHDYYDVRKLDFPPIKGGEQALDDMAKEILNTDLIYKRYIEFDIAYAMIGYKK